MSRIMLALKTILAKGDNIATLILMKLIRASVVRRRTRSPLGWPDWLGADRS